jgi:hypothetical protein
MALSGPLRNEVIPLHNHALSIGRDPQGDVCLDDPAVSRRHCTIHHEESGCALIDSGSFNGTFVNGFFLPMKKLVHGDRFRVGSSVFIYLERDEAPALDSGDANETWTSTLTAPSDRVAYEAPKTAVLDAFLRINAAINGIRSVEQIQACVLKLLFQVIPAERAAFLLTGHNQDEFVSATYARNNAAILVAILLVGKMNQPTVPRRNRPPKQNTHQTRNRRLTT